jgi:protein-S-isoprenylcysteine O-methyltransferase Ste14
MQLHRLIHIKPPRMAMGLAAAAVVVDWLFGWRIQVSTPHASAGALLGASGLLIMVWGWWIFRQADVAICPTAPTERLVTGGIYRLTRNPMYLGMTLMMAGCATAAGTASFYLAASAWFAVIDIVFCRYEEAKLTARFGDAYRAYTREVRRWV